MPLMSGLTPTSPQPAVASQREIDSPGGWHRPWRRAATEPLPARGVGSALGGCLARDAFEPVAVAAPRGLVEVGHVVVVPPNPDRSVDELADDVGVAGVQVGFGDHVDEDP